MNEKPRFSAERLLPLYILVTIVFGLIGVRLFRMQVVQAETYLKKSDTNRIKAVELTPLRGLMYDRNGELIVDNYPSYTLYAVPYAIDQNPEVRDTLLTLSGLTNEQFEERLRKIPNNRYTPVRIIRDVPFNLYAALEERKVYLPGISFQIEPKRAYHHRIASHTLGHIGELKERDAPKFPDQEIGDIVGLAGLERTWNKALCGEKGFNYLEVDVMGRVIGPLSGIDQKPPNPGKDLILTIDVFLQEYAEELLGDGSGSVVAIEPKTGEVLVMASKPDYPPETFANVLTTEQWRALQEDPAKPLLHRAIQGAYPPGSIFKMAVLSAGLGSGIIDTDFDVTCNGGLYLGRWFSCWKKTGHGHVGHKESIEQSCDVFFYTVGLKLGIDRFSEWVGKFPFGIKTGIDLEHESAGLLPSRAFFDRRYGENKWSDGQLFNIAIGQGDVLVTPLQAAVYASSLANGGWWVTPHLVRGLQNPDSTREFLDQWEKHTVDIDPNVISIVRQDMLQVTEGARGTAHWLYDPRLTVAGKTGTAQNPHGKDHALFVAFAPFDDPQIAVSVVVEHGEHGSTAAAPIAYKIIRAYLGYDEAGWHKYRAKVLAEIAARRAEIEAAQNAASGATAEEEPEE